MKKKVVLSITLFIALAFIGCNMDNSVENVNQKDEQNVYEATDESPSNTEKTEETEKPNNESDIENTIDEFECNIPFDFSKHTERVSFPLNTAKGFEKMINKIKEIDPLFDGEGYYVWINTNAGNKSGSIKFTYYIGNEISTNKAYLFSVRNGSITRLLSTDRPVPENKDEFEKELIERVTNFKASYEPEKIDMSNVVETREKYQYNYDTGVLKYVFSVFREVEGVIQDEYKEIIIE